MRKKMRRIPSQTRGTEMLPPSPPPPYFFLFWVLVDEASVCVNEPSSMVLTFVREVFLFFGRFLRNLSLLKPSEGVENVGRC